jgi:hypothetical protein
MTCSACERADTSCVCDVGEVNERIKIATIHRDAWQVEVDWLPGVGLHREGVVEMRAWPADCVQVSVYDIPALISVLQQIVDRSKQRKEAIT